jgi:hypothetical protein
MPRSGISLQILGYKTKKRGICLDPTNAGMRPLHWVNNVEGSS